jgi:L-amino acid N-acyltransferase
MSDFSIRLAKRDDCAAISDIYNYYVKYCTCTWQVDPETLQEREKWFDEHDGAHPVTVVEAGGEVVAWGALSLFSTRGAYRLTVYDSVYVRTDMQGRGIGRAIVTDLIARARALGHHTIIASISADQKPSIALHGSLGFVEVARMREMGKKYDEWLDLVYMQLML